MKNVIYHYENKSIQLYWKFYHQKKKKKKKKNQIKILMFHISAQNIDCVYSQAMFLGRNK